MHEGLLLARLGRFSVDVYVAQSWELIPGDHEKGLTPILHQQAASQQQPLTSVVLWSSSFDPTSTQGF